jgi:GNAT-family acetyltransferase (TIGR03103 family)
MSKRYDPRDRRVDTLTTRSWIDPPRHVTEDMESNASVNCGWGRVIFGQTFREHGALQDVLRAEEPDHRDIALYLRDPQVLIARAPQEMFIDPSLTYRLWLHHYRPARQPNKGVVIRGMRTREDAEETNRIYAGAGMVVADPGVMWANQLSGTFTYLIAEDVETGEIIGTVTGIDHVKAFRDPESGSSLWCLAVDSQATKAGVGEALVRTLAERYLARGRAYLDLSVLHDNAAAIRLYERLGFERVPVFAVKRKNPINEPLFAQAPLGEELNPYAKLIVDEARRRGVSVKVLDAEGGYVRYSHGGREIVTRESLSELTTAVAMSRCDDKRVTRRVLEGAGLRVPKGREASTEEANIELLKEVSELVVKPARGEQGQGITVGVTHPDELDKAVAHARSFCPEVLLEEYVDGDDLRVVVIDHEVVAAAIRRPAQVIGTGEHIITELIEKVSARRSSATDGESSIPLDELTFQTVEDAGYRMDDVLPADETLRVRRTANLHTGGTIHDVTSKLHKRLAEVSVAASRALDIPVVGLDLMVPDVEDGDYVFIEANERPGLANHEPQPTAERFVDLLFPQTARR